MTSNLKVSCTVLVVYYRDLAQEFKVGWNEYWPFLDTFANLASQDGLQKLEDYLKKRFLEAWQQQDNCDVSNTGFERYDDIKHGCATASPESSESQARGNEVVSPVSDLCLAFKACSLSDVSPGKPLVQSESRNARNVYNYQGRDANAGVEDEALLDVLLNPGLSPFLYVDKSCHVFAKRIFNGLAVVAHNAQTGDVPHDVLRPEIRHLQGLVSSFKDDARFVSVDFDLVHSRIAEIVALKLIELTGDELDFIVLGLKSASSPSCCCYSDEEDDVVVNYRNTHTYADHRRKRDGERNQIRCIAEHILGALDKRESDKQRSKDSSAVKVIHAQKEEECIRIWSEAIKCSCFRQNQNFVRNARKTSSYKRRHNVRYLSSKNKADAASSLDGITRRLAFEGEDGEFVKPMYLHRVKGYVHMVCRSVECYPVCFIYLFVEIKVDYSLEWFGDIVVSVYQILCILPPANGRVTVRHQVLLLCTVAKVGLQIYL